MKLQFSKFKVLVIVILSIFLISFALLMFIALAKPFQEKTGEATAVSTIPPTSGVLMTQSIAAIDKNRLVMVYDGFQKDAIESTPYVYQYSLADNKQKALSLDSSRKIFSNIKYFTSNNGKYIFRSNPETKILEYTTSIDLTKSFRKIISFDEKKIESVLYYDDAHLYIVASNDAPLSNPEYKLYQVNFTSGEKKMLYQANKFMTLRHIDISTEKAFVTFMTFPLGGKTQTSFVLIDLKDGSIKDEFKDIGTVAISQDAKAAFYYKADDLMKLDLATKQSTKIRTLENVPENSLVVRGSQTISPLNDYLIFNEIPDLDHSKVFLYNLQTEKVEEIDPGNNFQATSFYWSPDGKYVFLHSFNRGGWILDMSTKKVIKMDMAKLVTPIGWLSQ